MKFAALSLCLFLLIPVSAAQKAASFLRRAPEWFRSAEAAKIAGNILSFQADAGDWPKNTDTVTAPFAGDRSRLKGTFDNSATIPELKFLARIHAGTNAAQYRDAFLKGLRHILDAQYPNGGWPQSFPVSKGYDRHITFNDETMVNIMNFVREVGSLPDYDFVDLAERERARRAFDRGINCILKCQIQVDGQLTAWCAQHDEITLEPRPARAYELVSLSGSESAGIARLLMSLEKPSPEIIAAVDAAVRWFEAVKLKGIRQIQLPDPKGPKGLDKRIVADETAPPLWARFYDIKTMKPMFVDRDGIPKSSLAEIGYERRNGYSWYVTAPAQVLAAYPGWRKKVHP